MAFHASNFESAIDASEHFRIMQRVLIVATHFPPCEVIGAKRPSKMANFLAENGWDVTVLTVNPALTPPTGPAALDKRNLKIIRTDAFVPYVRLKNRFVDKKPSEIRSAPTANQINAVDKQFHKTIKSLRNYVVRKVLTAFDQVDEWSGWKKLALRAVKKNGINFDIVLSTIPPYSTALLGMEIAAYYRCKYVLDYRDPWVDMLRVFRSAGECSTKMLERHSKLERKCLNASDLILTVSPAIAEMLGSRVNKRIMTVPQGFEGEIAESSFDSESKYLLYAGSLAYGRDISQVLSAIKHTADALHENLRLVYCGLDSGRAYEQANSVGATAYIDLQGHLREQEVLEYAKRSLCNIVLVSAGYEYAYPGKLFDLIPAGRPIYVFSPRGSEAGKLVEQFGLGYSFMATDKTALTERLRGEINRQFIAPIKAYELKAECVYERMVEEGLSTL